MLFITAKQIIEAGGAELLADSGRKRLDFK
jgi:hypothetical protein